MISFLKLCLAQLYKELVLVRVVNKHKQIEIARLLAICFDQTTLLYTKTYLITIFLAISPKAF
jgi:hypothetical protein